MQCSFRKATILDFELLFLWRNDPITLLNSINSEKISIETHEKWLSASIVDPTRKLYIFESDSRPLGTVKFDQEGSAWELSWTVSPEARGKGIGKRMVQQAVRIMSGKLMARVKIENLASISIAESAGFHRAFEKNGLIIFELIR
jgi:RimJ/RimL family protein N-acetyltransferase